MKKRNPVLNDEALHILGGHFNLYTYRSDDILAREKQVPPVAMILINGTVELYKKKNFIEELRAGTLVGVYNLVRNIPFHFEYRIKANSQLLILPKSELMTILWDRKSLLYHLLKAHKH